MIVFHDDNSSDPTHSMLSKDHFSNILNEPAGKVASQVLKWAVPQLIACWDDERIDVDRTLTRIINGVFHHPALRDYGDDGAVDGRRLMFGIVENWWGEKGEEDREMLRDQLSRNGVEEGRNHKEGVHDSGHGCGKPLGMPNMKTAGSSGAIGGLAAGSILEDVSSALSGQSKYDSGYTGGGGQSSGGGSSSGVGKFAGEAVGGGALGGIVGGLVGGLGGDLLGDAFGGSDSQRKSYKKESYGEDGSYTQSVTETGYSQSQYGSEQQRYGQAEYSQTSLPGGGQREEYQRYEQEGQYGQTGYGQQVVQESRPTYGGGYEQTTERRYEQAGGEWQSEVRREGRDARGENYEQTDRYEGRRVSNNDSSNSDEEKKKHKKKHHKHDSDSDNDENLAYGRQSGGYNTEQRSYGEQQSYGESRQEYGQRNEYQSQNLDESYRADESREYGSGGGFGREREEGFGQEREEGFGQRDDYQREERAEDFGEDRGYGRGNEYQERQEGSYDRREGYGDGY